jgi:hypothetical protein
LYSKSNANLFAIGESADGIVILGGLVSSTPLTLLALPGLAARFLRPADRAARCELA